MTGRRRYWRITTLRDILVRRPWTPVAAPARQCTIGCSDGPTGIAHSVTEEAFAAGRRAGGRYVAVCGAQVCPASLTAPVRYHCPACERGS